MILKSSGFQDHFENKIQFPRNPLQVLHGLPYLPTLDFVSKWPLITPCSLCPAALASLLFGGKIYQPHFFCGLECSHWISHSFRSPQRLLLKEVFPDHPISQPPSNSIPFNSQLFSFQSTYHHLICMFVLFFFFFAHPTQAISYMKARTACISGS